MIEEEAAFRCGGKADLLIALTEGRVKKKQGKCGFPLYYFVQESSGCYDSKGKEEAIEAKKDTTVEAMEDVRDFMSQLRWTDLFEVCHKQ